MWKRSEQVTIVSSAWSGSRPDLKESGEFDELWQRHEVATRFDDHKTPLHPEVGALELDCQALPTEDRWSLT